MSETNKSATIKATERKIGEWDKEEAKCGGDHTHSDIWHSDFIIFPNIFEIKVSIISRKKCSERDEEFSQRRVDIYIVLSFDVLRGKLAKVDFVETG